MKAIPLFLTMFLLGSLLCAQTPAPFGATPSERQLKWHEMEYYAFVHFNMNTFTGREWGNGKEPAQWFAPTQLDCRQWARVCRDAGMKGIIITAKHHDGFCLWPTKYSEHSVKNSSWKNGKGDVLRELSDACREYGLKMGVYLSPWDQNNPAYGTPGYNEIFKKQLEEVLTNYGDIFEVWFDGAVGEEFKGKQIYDWPGFIETVRKYQPNAVIFSDAGPDVRWVGTEEGFANATNWATLNRDNYEPGTSKYMDLRSGNQRGTHWLPAEVDVSIRPGWYYHREQDQAVKSPDHLEQIYYYSVGRNANLLLNLPVDQRGLVHEHDAAALMALKQRLDATFSANLARNARATTNASGNTAGLSNLTDDQFATYWAAGEGTGAPGFEIDLGAPRTFNVLELQEYIPLGQRIEAFKVEAWQNGKWVEIGSATTIGNKRLLPLPRTTTSRVRVTFTKYMASPVISNIALYLRPHENYLLESKPEFDQRMNWWRDAGFGMFIHWGAYAVPGGVHEGKEVSSAGEWIMNTAKIPIPIYEHYVRQFHPVQFNAEEWVRIAKDAGMKYIVITSKHHDGFGLWDSKVSPYDVMDASPYRQDVLKELADACKKAGIKFCFYHSIMDWHHPDAQGAHFPNYNTDAQSNRNFKRYRDEYMLPQLKELVEGYDPAVLWFDGEWIPEWSEAQGKDLYQYVRSLKPDIIVNNRVGKGRQGMQGMNKTGEYVGDFGTPEQEILDFASVDLDWESCMTMNDSWGFKKNDLNWKSSENLIHNLVDIAAKGGNYLLNVGPTPEGLIPAASVERLREMGEWLRANGPVVYGSRMWKQYKEGDHIRYTVGQDGAVYATLLKWPEGDLHLRYIQPNKGSAIRLLGYDQPLAWTFNPQTGLTVKFPPELRDPARRPGQYAWSFRIEGTYPQVAVSPTFHSGSTTHHGMAIFKNELLLEMKSTTPGATIYYTLDGSEPTAKSNRYTRPVRLTNTSQVRAIAVKKGLVNSPSSGVDFRRSAYNDISVKNPYTEKYSGGGKLGLLDGLYGTTRFSDGRWQGYEGVDLDAVIDLGEVRSLSGMKATFLQDQGSWIFSPLQVTFAVSDDGVTYQTVGAFDFSVSASQTATKILPVEQKLNQVKARFVKVYAKNVGICPTWHAGAGGKAWLFVDEIEIR